MGTKLGFIFSIEALLAAVFLFGIFLLTSDINRLDQDYSQNSRILSHYTDGTLTALEKSKALDDLFKTEDDTKIINISESMPASLCTQIELYNYSLLPSNLYYSYTSENCTRSWDTPINSQLSTYINRTNITNISIFWVKAIHYARK